jgi:hypothetical protein
MTTSSDVYALACSVRASAPAVRDHWRLGRRGGADHHRGGPRPPERRLPRPGALRRGFAPIVRTRGDQHRPRHPAGEAQRRSREISTSSPEGARNPEAAIDPSPTWRRTPPRDRAPVPPGPIHGAPREGSCAGTAPVSPPPSSAVLSRERPAPHGRRDRRANGTGEASAARNGSAASRRDALLRRPEQEPRPRRDRAAGADEAARLTAGLADQPRSRRSRRPSGGRT